MTHEEAVQIATEMMRERELLESGPVLAEGIDRCDQRAEALRVLLEDASLLDWFEANANTLLTKDEGEDPGSDCMWLIVTNNDDYMDDPDPSWGRGVRPAIAEARRRSSTPSSDSPL